MQYSIDGTPLIRHCENCEYCHLFKCNVKHEVITAPRLAALFCRFYKVREKLQSEAKSLIPVGHAAARGIAEGLGAATAAALQYAKGVTVGDRPSKYYKLDSVPIKTEMTNREKVNGMTDEELAEVIGCPYANHDIESMPCNEKQTDCKTCTINWLRSTADH